jgi:hypothetical protein
MAYDADGGSASSAVVNVTVSTASALPVPQTAADIGTPAVAGSTTYQGGTYTIKAGGTDIWNTSDQFQFVYQPMDGDHMGTAPHNEFCLAVPAGLDEKPDPMEAKELQELSAKSAKGSHPGVFLLFPNNKPAEEPQLASKGEGIWVLNLKAETSSSGQRAPLGQDLAEDLAVTALEHGGLVVGQVPPDLTRDRPSGPSSAPGRGVRGNYAAIPSRESCSW